LIGIDQNAGIELNFLMRGDDTNMGSIWAWEMDWKEIEDDWGLNERC
jgi:hypothetical protein